MKGTNNELKTSFSKPPNHEKYKNSELGVIRFMMENYITSYILSYSPKEKHNVYYDNFEDIKAKILAPVDPNV